MARRRTPGTVRPEAGRNPGYAEPQPQDRRDAQEPEAPAPSRGDTAKETPDAGRAPGARRGAARKPPG